MRVIPLVERKAEREDVVLGLDAAAPDRAAKTWLTRPGQTAQTTLLRGR